MTADIHHVVDSAQDPVIAVGIAAGGVAREVGSRDSAPILFFVALGISPDRSNHRRPGPANNQKSFAIGADFVAAQVHDGRDDSRHGQRSGARLGGNGSRHWRDHYSAGFGLPPSVDDGTAALAD